MNTVAISLSAFAAVMSLIAGIITSMHQRGVSQEANEIDRFEAIISALELRVSGLERELGTVKQSLIDEQAAHRRTQEGFRLALRYIRELITWARGSRAAPMPSAPAELETEL